MDLPPAGSQRRPCLVPALPEFRDLAFGSETPELPPGGLHPREQPTQPPCSERNLRSALYRPAQPSRQGIEQIQAVERMGECRAGGLSQALQPEVKTLTRHQRVQTRDCVQGASVASP